ncbi:MAG: hypothetical protein AB7O59_11790 [Pirellulales bacterium]
MHPFASLKIVCACSALAMICGCGQRLYRAETKLDADGRVSRAVYQPIEDTPAEARDPRLWSGVNYAVEIPPDKWAGTIRELPTGKADNDHSYFAAWGDFTSPAKLPTTYLKPAPQGLPDGRLSVDYERVDHVFVVEHRWTETLTDIVTLEDMHRSRRKFLDVMIPLVERCLEVGLGPDYDVSGVTEWMRTIGTSWFEEATDAFFEAGTRGQLPPNDGWKESMADVCGRYGLKLRDDSGRLLTEDPAREKVSQFATELLRARIKRRDGAPVPQAAIDDLLEWVNLKDATGNDNPRLARLDGLAQKVIVEQFGSQQNFEDVVTPLGARMLGLYRAEILGPPRKFHYELELPGTIVESNGVIESGNRVCWNFEAVEAYPFGYRMECRALAPQTQLEQELLNGTPLTSSQDMLDYLAALKRDFLLLETLRRCVKAKSMEPLSQVRSQVVTEGGDTRPYDTVLRLLEPAK